MKDRYALFAGLFAAVFVAIFAGSCVSQGPVIADAAYTFSPRLQATQGGVEKDVYLDRVIVKDGYLNVVLVDTPVGKGSNYSTSRNWGAINYTEVYKKYANGLITDNFPTRESSTVLWDLDNPAKTWHVVRTGEDTDTGGMFITFDKVTAARIAITNDTFYPPMAFEEIILSVPD
jgi:hypothetical protein